MEPTLVPLNDPDLVILICDSNVHHELGASEYPVRRAHCEQGAKILGKQSLRDATMEELIGKKNITYGNWNVFYLQGRFYLYI